MEIGDNVYVVNYDGEDITKFQVVRKNKFGFSAEKKLEGKKFRSAILRSDEENKEWFINPNDFWKQKLNNLEEEMKPHQEIINIIKEKIKKIKEFISL